jgi:hypothetical protein
MKESTSVQVSLMTGDGELVGALVGFDVIVSQFGPS